MRSEVARRWRCRRRRKHNFSGGSFLVSPDWIRPRSNQDFQEGQTWPTRGPARLHTVTCQQNHLQCEGGMQQLDPQVRWRRHSSVSQHQVSLSVIRQRDLGRGLCWRSQPSHRIHSAKTASGLVTNSIIFCWLYTIKDRCKIGVFSTNALKGFAASVVLESEAEQNFLEVHITKTFHLFDINC